MNAHTNPEELHNRNSEEQERLSETYGQENTERREDAGEEATNPEGISSLDQSRFNTEPPRRNKPLDGNHEPGTVPGADIP